MKLTIREIKEKCETDDKVNFKGVVEKVWQFNKKDTKYSIGYQNIIIKDDTDKIKVIFSSIKTEADIHKENIEGEEVEVSGKVSIYNNETNIFGKITFKEEQEKPREATNIKTNIERLNPVASLSVTGITKEEIRIKCLEITAMLYRAETEATTGEWIMAAKKFEEYVCQDKKTSTKISKTKKKTTTEARPEEKEEDNGEKLSQEHIKQINMLMALVENRGEKGKELINEIVEDKGYTTVKEFSINEIKEATKELEKMGTEDIPF